MATKGSDLSTRTSAEARDIVKLNAGIFFKRHKVQISNAIKAPFPFLEILRDRGFITNKKYNEYQEKLTRDISTQQVVYSILCGLEKTFDLSLLDSLFSKTIMKFYPDLYYTYKIFKNEISNISNYLESDAEENKGRSDSQLSLEQGSKKHKEEYVDFHSEILPVTCGEMKGMLYKNKLEEGSTVKCIKTEDGKWFTPQEFEAAGNYKSSRNWKNTVRCGGKTLKRLMEEGKLPTPPTIYSKKKKLEKPDVCKICRDGENLLCCDTCSRFFHGDCHLPPVQTERRPWSCTFCRIKKSSGSQQCHKESEVLARPMGPEEQLKCAFLLLNVYGPLESKVFSNVPHENYVEEASRCLEKLRKLDEIKKSLIKGDYPYVGHFVWAMEEFFTIPSCNDTEFTKNDFKKTFKDIFAIQKTN
ncbi:hypothetical protein HJG60_017938 [Phyllostomus discolor]|uniref:Nuclear body protein SP140-like protein n=1 Tax=Phyllostomus discolor TaxID=89673 RepID=A0A834APQ8_9CHIR|nr:hypothetical protein HJG60_017938 [Phyllostomus discolor]